MQTLFSQHWHHLPLDEVATLMESDGDRGLDMFEVSRRQAHFGPNQLSLKKRKNPLLLFLQQFHQPLIYILLAAVAVTSALKEWVDSGVIFGVVLVNSVIGYIQESKALKAIEALNQLFGSASLGYIEWAWILAGGLMIYSVVGTEKWLRRRADSKGCG